MHIRPYRPEDADAVSRICVLTGDAGGDATGLFSSDELLPDVFVRPYVTRHAELAFVVEADDRRVVGYIVGVPDTDAFEEWFHDEWWPSVAARYPLPDAERSREDGTVIYAHGRRAGAEPYGAEYPAHLHIDLLPEAQGQGWGRRLIETLVGALRERGVTGLHLTAAAENAGALLFYPRVGFTALPSHEGVQAFGRHL